MERVRRPQTQKSYTTQKVDTVEDQAAKVEKTQKWPERREINWKLQEAIEKAKARKIFENGLQEKIAYDDLISTKTLADENDHRQEAPGPSTYKVSKKVPTNYGQWLRNEREKQGWTQGQLAKKLDKPITQIRYWEKGRAYPDVKTRHKLETLTRPDVSNLRMTETRVTAFFKGLAKTLVSGILGAVFLPFFGPVVATATAVTLLTATSIQEKLEPLGLHLQEDTIHKLAEPLKGKRFDESDLQKVIEEVLSKDRQANEDLAKAFIDLVPIIKNAASTNIEILGPIQGLIVGEKNTITQTFNGFLKENL